MKKLLFLLIAMNFYSVILADSFDDLINSVKNKKVRKDREFDQMKDSQNRKIDLLKKEHDENYDLSIKYLEQLKAMNVDQKWAQDKFNEETALENRHLDEHKQLNDQHNSTFDNVYKQNKTDLNTTSVVSAISA